MTNLQVLKDLANGVKTSWLSKITEDIFTEAGFQEMLDNDYRLLDDFFNLSVRVVLNKILQVNPRIPAYYSAVIEEFANEKGGIQQRINEVIMRPVNPAYRNLQEGTEVSDGKIRKPHPTERFYRQNFDFANFVTRQDIDLRKIFLDESGIADFVAGITRNLEASYYIAKFELFKKVLRGAITSTQTPLQDSQIINATGDNAELANITDTDKLKVQQAWKQFVFCLDELKDTMNSNPLLDCYNAAGFENGVNPDDHIILIRHSVLNYVKRCMNTINSGSGSLNDPTTTAGLLAQLPFKAQVVEDFGDAVRVLKSDHSTVLKETFDDNGAPIGWNTTGTGDPLPKSQIDVIFEDEDTFALLVQKGVIFATKMNPFTIRIKEKYRGMYYNFIANQPNGAMNYDSNYTIVKFTKATS